MATQPSEEHNVILPGTVSRGSLSSGETSYSSLEDLSEIMHQVDTELLVPSSAGTLAKRKAEEPPESSESSANKSQKLDSPFDLKDFSLPFVIAHSHYLQQCFDSRNIAFGVQWLLARYVLCGFSYDKIQLSHLDQLKGSNQDAAPRIQQIILGTLPRKEQEELASKGYFAKETAVMSPWRELDREQNFVVKDDRGFYEDINGVVWYGGRVQFTGKVMDAPDTDHKYRIMLNWPELGPSTRFGRFFGSKNVLRIRVPQNIKTAGLIDFFRHPFILCGLVFRAFYAKDRNVFLIATDELIPDVVTRLPRHALPRPISFLDFLDWHNPIALNTGQTMAKWASRFALGLSNSVPGLLLKELNIVIEPDIVCCGSDMTDGCGYANSTMLKMLRKLFDWNEFPTAIQCRIAGAKGLLLLHPSEAENQAPEPRVWLRPSQIKILYSSSSPAPSSRLFVDILRSSHLRTPSRLSAETIINLAENGVPTEVFVNLMNSSLDAKIDPLLAWDGPDAMFSLWLSVAQTGSVMKSRRAREAGGEARARGLGDRDAEEEDGDEIDDLHAAPSSTAWWGDEVSGCPSSLEETVMVLLDAGFKPETCPVLAEKLKMIALSVVENHVQRYRCDLPMSCIAFMVPDPTGTLAPNEVHIKCSNRDFILPDGTETDTIVGDVLVTRHPCKVPTDIRKVVAVERAELHNYTDVIVCSVQGFRRFADFLAGGDYDGDKAIVIWDPLIVSPFANPDEKYSIPPEDLDNNFERVNVKVSDHIREFGTAPPEVQIQERQKYLLSAIRDSSAVGKYSNFHEAAIYTLGYRHPETIRLAYMFCAILDGAKSGMTVLSDVMREDMKKFNKRPPQWRETQADRELANRSGSNEINLKRPKNLPDFVMDTIFHKAGSYCMMKKNKVMQVFGNPSRCEDKALTRPWLLAVERVAVFERELAKNHAGGHPEAKSLMRKELDKIEEHVRHMYEEHKKRRTGNFTQRKIEFRQDTLRQLAQDFAAKPDPREMYSISEDEVMRLRASYAYLYDHQRSTVGWSRFPWDVAMRELGAIKAQSLGPSKVVTLGFYERFQVKKSLVKRV